ncbi:hypothetical protein T492DRAFT_1058686 [Pavlovales sp. CCMP2436]|nr:hypothetical protein T492DRAFT_1058686 [Pavlovales sp. CCMP2436]
MFCVLSSYSKFLLLLLSNPSPPYTHAHLLPAPQGRLVPTAITITGSVYEIYQVFSSYSEFLLPHLPYTRTRRAQARLVPTAITIALIGYLELIAIGKSLASKLGYALPAGIVLPSYCVA